MSGQKRPLTQMGGFTPTQMHDSVGSGGATENTDLTTSPPPSKKQALDYDPRSWPPSKKLRQDPADAMEAKKKENQPLIRATPQRRYHELMTLDQAGPAVIGYDDTDRCSFVAIKRRKRPEGSFIPQVQVKSNHLVSLKDMYIEGNDIVFIYEQMDVSLRHITGIARGSLKAFQIAAICKEVRISCLFSCVCSRLRLVGERASLLT